MQLDLIKPPSIIRRIIERYKAGYSPIILFCGKPRTSKTTKAYLMMHWIHWLLFNKPWDWRASTPVTFEQLIRTLEDPNTPIKFTDEVQRLLSKGDALKRESKMWGKITTSQAYLHYIFAMILVKASTLASEHAAMVDFVIYVKSRRQILPYKLDNNMWDIDLKRHEKSRKIYLSHFNLDIKDPIIKKAFADELKDLPEFKKYIEVNIKEKIMDDIKEEIGLKEVQLPNPIKINDDFF